VGQIAGMGEVSNAYKMLIGKTEGKRPLGRPRHRREDNIRTDIGEMIGKSVLGSPGSG